MSDLLRVDVDDDNFSDIFDGKRTATVISKWNHERINVGDVLLFNGASGSKAHRTVCYAEFVIVDNLPVFLICFRPALPEELEKIYPSKK